jgi:hypothetical protein
MLKRLRLGSNRPQPAKVEQEGFWRREIEFHADKNTSCYCLLTIKSAFIGGLLRQAERLLLSF